MVRAASLPAAGIRGGVRVGPRAAVIIVLVPVRVIADVRRPARRRRWYPLRGCSAAPVKRCGFAFGARSVVGPARAVVVDANGARAHGTAAELVGDGEADAMRRL